MTTKDIVEGIRSILSELIKLNFKVTARGEVEEHRIHIYFSMTYHELQGKLPKLANTTELDHILQVLRYNGQIEFSDGVDNPPIKITPKGVDDYFSEMYHEKYLDGKTKYDKFLKGLPILGIFISVLGLSVKELLPPSTQPDKKITVLVMPQMQPQPKKIILSKTVVHQKQSYSN